MAYQLLAILKCQSSLELYDNGESQCYTTLVSSNNLGRFVILQFRDAFITIPRVIEFSDNVMIHLPLTYFQSLYPLFQDAFYHLKYTVTCRLAALAIWKLVTMTECGAL